MIPNTKLSSYNFNQTMIERTHSQKRKVKSEFLISRLNWRKKVEIQKKLKLSSKIRKLLNINLIHNKWWRINNKTRQGNKLKFKCTHQFKLNNLEVMVTVAINKCLFSNSRLKFINSNKWWGNNRWWPTECNMFNLINN